MNSPPGSVNRDIAGVHPGQGDDNNESGTTKLKSPGAISDILSLQEGVQQLDISPNDNGAAGKLSPVEGHRTDAPPFSEQPASLPVNWTVSTQFVSVETLRTYGIDYSFNLNREFVTILRHVPDYEMEFLKRHTEEGRKNRPSREPLASPQQLPPTRRGHTPPPPRVRPRSQSPASIFPEADILNLEINRVPFEKWMVPGNKRGESVLDIALQRRIPFEPKRSSGTAKTSQTPNSNSSNAEQDIEVPVRLAINSVMIRAELSKITGYKFGYYNKVMHDPWKVLIIFQKEIKTRFRVLKDKLDALKEPKPNGIEYPLIEPAKESENESDDEDYYSEDPEARIEERKAKIDHLQCLINFMDEDLKPVFDFRRALKEATIKEIAFKDLWHLFSPGDLLATSGARHERQSYKVFHTCAGRPVVYRDQSFGFEKAPAMTSFTLDSYSMDFDSDWIGPVHQTLQIPPYEGHRPITALPMFSHTGGPQRRIPSAFPVRFVDEPEADAIAHLIRRGKRNKELYPFSHKRYCGVAASMADPEYLNSEIIIDATQDTGNTLIGIFRNIATHTDEVPEGCTADGPCYKCTDIFNDNCVDRDLASRYTKDKHLLGKRDAADANLTDDHFMLFPASTDAFVLRERDTFAVFVDLIKDLDGDHGESLKTLKKQSGFEDLVLPEGHGDLVEALVKSHRSTRNRKGDDAKVQVDLIDGKGEGLIILLHGVPGVGKTSTAECVAAYTRRPLYPITCANIGLDPEEVEKKLTGPEGHFRRAQQWNCVVLLDEADVFLAKRETRSSDAKRNALVSVFLRTLEYYPGILILTTNRVGAFDEAVISRIQLFLYYPPLDEEKTMEVWRVHITRVRSSGAINLDNEDKAMIMAFARKEYAEGRRWNGRQIRNFFQTAISLATYDSIKWHQQAIEDGEASADSKADKPRLTTRTLEIVAKTGGKFIDYINSTVPDGSHEKQQLDEGNRNDSWEETPKKSRRD